MLRSDLAQILGADTPDTAHLRLAAARNSGAEIIWCLASDRATETEMQGVIPRFLRPSHAILWAVMGFDVMLGDNRALHSSLLE